MGRVSVSDEIQNVLRKSGDRLAPHHTLVYRFIRSDRTIRLFFLFILFRLLHRYQYVQSTKLL